MDATLIVIDSDAELTRAQQLLAKLMVSEDPADIARLTAQARLIEAYEISRWPSSQITPSVILEYLMDQHGLTRADLVPFLGTSSRVSELLNGKAEFSMSMIQRLRARFHVPADVLMPATTGATRRSPRQRQHKAA